MTAKAGTKLRINSIKRDETNHAMVVRGVLDGRPTTLRISASDWIVVVDAGERFGNLTSALTMELKP